jgi:hypothetical protein
MRTDLQIPQTTVTGRKATQAKVNMFHAVLLSEMYLQEVRVRKLNVILTRDLKLILAVILQF